MRAAVLWLAVRAGLAPLAADRAGASASAAVGEAGGEVTLVATADGSATMVRISGDDGSERVLRLERAPLRPV